MTLSRIFFLSACLGMLPCSAMNQAAPKTQQAISLTNQATALAHDVAHVLFNPANNPYPATSFNASTIDALFGPLQAKLVPDTARYIKNCYFYLEYATKVERAAYLAALAQQEPLTDAQGKSADFLTLVGSGGWQAVVAAVSKKYSTPEALKTALSTIKTPAWSLANGAIKAASWQKLVESDFWTAIVVTPTDLIQSAVWQEYVSYMATQAFSYDNSLLASINQSQAGMFRYVPDIETVYFQPDYTRLRQMAELFRINLILTDNLRDRLLYESTAWQQYRTSLQQAYDATRVYAKTPLYSYFAAAEEQFSQTLNSIQQKQFKIPDALVQEPLAIERITFIAMTKSIHALLQPLYTLDNLPDTMTMLAKTPQLVPNVMLHAQEDGYLLEDRAALVSLVTQAAGSPPTQQSSGTQTVALRAPTFGVDNDVIVQSFFGDIGHFFQSAGESVFHLGKSLGEGVEALAFKTGATFASIVDKKTANNLSLKAQQLTQKSREDFEIAYKDAQKTIDAISHVAKDITGGVGKGIGFLLGKDAEGLFDAITDLALDNIIDMAHAAVGTTAGVVRLSLDAVAVVSDVILNSLETVISGNTQQFNHLGTDLKQFGSHIITTILDVVTLAIDTFTDNLKDIIRITSYVVSILTDLFIDIATGAAFFVTGLIDIFGAGIDPLSAARSTQEALEMHRRTLDSIGSTALMIGATVATGGAAAPMIAMIGAQQAFQVIGSYQQDELQAEKRQEEKKFLDAYRIFVNNNKLISTEQQLTWSQELNQKYQAEITNQERNLGFYQNYLNQTFNGYQEHMAQQLGSYLAPQLVPDARYNTVYADIGSIYGFSTGVYDFNPSQGFSLYSKGRDAFSQEIAVLPAADGQKSSTATFTDSSSSKFWFIQQDTYTLAQEPQIIEVRLRAIYVLTTYHIGLYFGGRPYDIQAIKKNSIAPVDAGHLAKMLVFKKTVSAQPATTGLYQHEALSLDETKNWLYQSPTPNPEFHVGTWYRMKMNMAGPTTLQFKIWPESETEPGWQQVTVQQQPEPLTTLGIISSGASVEYQILSPAPTIAVVNDAQGKPLRTKLPTEKEREANAQLVMQQLSKPTLGTFNLTIADKIALLRSQFMYTTQNSSLKTADNKPVTDYVLLCQLRDDNSIQDASIGSSLAKLNQDKAGIVSAVTGNAYNQSGTQVGVYPAAYAAWLKEHGPLHTTLEQAITTAQKNYAALMTQPITFGAFTLQPTSDQEIRNGQFIYTTAQHTDFFIFVQESQNNQNILHHNLPYASTLTAALSLVSGDVYDNSSPNKVIDSGYSAAEYLQGLEKITPLRPDLKAMIVAAQTAHAAQPTKETTGQNPTQPTSDSAVTKSEGATTGSQGTDTKITTTAVPDKSLIDQQKSASDDEICFGC